MGRRKKSEPLSRRERQILDVIFRLGEAAVGDVLPHLPDPPAYDSVRTMIRSLERKGYLQHRREGTRYIYRPTQSHKTASRSAVSHLMTTFFRDSVADTVAAVLDVASNDLTDAELKQLEQLIEQARKEGR